LEPKAETLDVLGAAGYALSGDGPGSGLHLPSFLLFNAAVAGGAEVFVTEKKKGVKSGFES